MSEWISVKDRLPKEGEVVDIFVPAWGRLTDYQYVKNHGGKRGNNFFEPEKGGICCVREATHWMPSPEPPKEADNG